MFKILKIKALTGLLGVLLNCKSPELVSTLTLSVQSKLQELISKI